MYIILCLHSGLFKSLKRLFMKRLWHMEMVNYNIVRWKTIKMEIYEIISTIVYAKQIIEKLKEISWEIWIVALLVFFFFLTFLYFSLFLQWAYVPLCSKQISFSSNITMLSLFSECKNNSWFQIVFSIHMALCRISKFTRQHLWVHTCLVESQIIAK